MCTASLVDAYSAMANAAEEHWGLAAAHPLYAALLEKVLAEVARQHIMKLEILAQVGDKDALSPSLHLVMTLPMACYRACPYTHATHFSWPGACIFA